jgi:hypothetical protein
MTYGYIFGSEQPDKEVKFPKGRYVAGAAVGILIAEIWRPIFPGAVANATSFDFPVLFKLMKGTTIKELLSGDPRLIDLCIDGGKDLIQQGARAIIGSVGYFASYQREVANALNVPVFMSSLLQLPMMAQSLKKGQKIGIIWAHKVSSEYLDQVCEQCGISDPAILVNVSCENLPEFKKIIEWKGQFNTAKLEREMVGLCNKLVADHPDVAALLLECGEMPVYSWAIQNAIELPVFDYLTLINWVQSGFVQRPRNGFM